MGDEIETSDWPSILFQLAKSEIDFLVVGGAFLSMSNKAHKRCPAAEKIRKVSSDMNAAVKIIL